MLLVGSVTSLACGSQTASGRAATLTYNKDIAPLLWEHCGTCHRPGELAPFSLLEYSDVKARAREIQRVTTRRVMPPWLPEPGYGEFANDRRLKEEEIDRIEQWVRQGAVEGEAADRRAPPSWVDGWQLGNPDLVVELPAPYTLRPGRVDVFRNFVLPISVPSTRYVRGMEVRPGNRHIVHHASLAIDRTRTSRLLDESDPEPGYEGMFSEGAHSPESHALGWTPGMTPVMDPSDMAWRLEPGSDLIIQLHMMPAHLHEPESVKPSVGLFFSDTLPTKAPLDFKLGSKAIDIPAGVPDYVAEDRYVLPVDVDVLSVYPHAHYLCKEMKAFATLPDGSVKWLIWIKDWNFSWQDQYRYARPVLLPRGTTLTMRYTYDNSAGNSRNPHQPPQRVSYGPQSSDEMGDLWLRFLPHSRNDAAVLARAFVENELRKDIGVAEQGVAEHPHDAKWQGRLGTRYLEAGRVREGVPHLQEAIRLAPRDAESHNNLGLALREQGQLGDAILQFREAVEIAPENEQIHINLANALQDRGELPEAIQHLRAALALNPSVAETYNNLGVALAASGLVDLAAKEFQRALDIRPDYADAQTNLNLARQLRDPKK